MALSFPYGTTVRMNDAVINGCSNLIVHGDRNTITAGFSSTVHGNNNTVTGHNATVNGSDNVINGCSAIVTGNGNRVTGNYAEVNGMHNTVDGNSSRVTGNGNYVTGSYSMRVTGHGNRVTGGYMRVDGNFNTVDGSNASVNGVNNEVTGRHAKTSGSNNTVNGIPAEQEQQRQERQTQQEIEQLQQQMQQPLPPLQLSQLQMELQRLLCDQLHTMTLFRQPFGILQQVQQPAPVLVPQQQHPPRQPIKLTLRGCDEESTDENGDICHCCWVNKAVIASICCGKLAACLACARTLYEGKMVGEGKCLSCQGIVEHAVRIS